jgi:excisionase family DNA binding protein
METSQHELQTGSPPSVMVNPQPKLLYSKREAASLLSISIRKLEYLILNKELVSRKVGRRVLIPFQELQKFARQDHPSRRIQ